MDTVQGWERIKISKQNWRNKNREKLRKYKREWQRAYRKTKKEGITMVPAIRIPNKGNDKWQELGRAEIKWRENKYLIPSLQNA